MEVTCGREGKALLLAHELQRAPHECVGEGVDLQACVTARTLSGTERGSAVGGLRDGCGRARADDHPGVRDEAGDQEATRRR